MTFMNIIDNAIALIQHNKTEEALEILSSEATKADEQEQLDIAQIYIELGLIDRAEVLLTKIIGNNPSQSEAKIMLAEIYTDEQKEDKAISLLNEISEADPYYLQSLLQLADVYQVQGLNEVALTKLLEAKNIEPNEPLIDLALGELTFSLGDYQRASIYFQKLINDLDFSDDKNVISKLAESYALTGEFERSLQYYEQLDSDHPEVVFRYGFVAYQLERYELAVSIWEKLKEKELEYSSLYPYLTDAYEQTGQIELAFQTIEEGIQVDSLNKELYLIAAKLALKLNDLKKAINYAQQSIALDNEYEDAISFLLEAYKQDGDHSAIIDLLTKQVDVTVLNGLFEWELAKILVEEEMFDQALKHYRNAYNKLKYDSEFLKEYGYFLMEEGRKDEAITVLRSYIQLEPADFSVAEYLQRIIEDDDLTIL